MKLSRPGTAQGGKINQGWGGTAQGGLKLTGEGCETEQGDVNLMCPPPPGPPDPQAVGLINPSRLGGVLAPQMEQPPGSPAPGLASGTVPSRAQEGSAQPQVTGSRQGEVAAPGPSAPAAMEEAEGPPPDPPAQLPMEKEDKEEEMEDEGQLSFSAPTTG